MRSSLRGAPAADKLSTATVGFNLLLGLINLLCYVYSLAITSIHASQAAFAAGAGGGVWVFGA
jgi:hypothetical protein